MKNFNQEKYIQDIKELVALNFHLHKDVNTNFNDFQNKLIEIIENNAPYITLPKNRETLYYKKFMKTKNKFWCDRYKHYRNILNILITKSKKKKTLERFLSKTSSKLKENVD